MTITTPPAGTKPKKTPEERLQAAKKRADAAAASALDLERKIAEQAEKKRRWALSVLGEWLERAMREDITLRRRVKQQFATASLTPYTQEALAEFWLALGEPPEVTPAAHAEPTSKPPRSITTAPRAANASADPKNDPTEASAAGAPPVSTAAR